MPETTLAAVLVGRNEFEVQELPIPEIPPDAGLLVPAGNVSAFANALRQVVGDDGLRGRMASASRAAATHLPTWRQSAEVFARALES